MTAQLEKSQVHFIHLKNETLKGGITLAYAVYNEKIITGIGYCHKNDAYSKKAGSNLALQRLNAHITCLENNTDKATDNPVREYIGADGIYFVKDSSVNKIISIEFLTKDALAICKNALISAVQSTLENSMLDVYSNAIVDNIYIAIEDVLNKATTNDLRTKALNVLIQNLIPSII